MRTALVLLLFTFSACTADPEPATKMPTPAASQPAVQEDETGTDETVVLFIGDSLTAGYGLSKSQAYPALIEAKAADAGTPIDAVNAGVSGDTSAGGRSRTDWLLRSTTPDVLVLALGANDGLRGLPTDQMKANLLDIIASVRSANPEVRVVLAGMQTLTNYGGDYGRRYAAVFPEVAEEASVDAYLPFLLENVAAVPSLNLPDGVHPNAEGQRILANNVWGALAPVVREVVS